MHWRLWNGHNDNAHDSDYVHSCSLLWVVALAPADSQGPLTGCINSHRSHRWATENKGRQPGFEEYLSRSARHAETRTLSQDPKQAQISFKSSEKLSQCGEGMNGTVGHALHSVIGIIQKVTSFQAMKQMRIRPRV